MSRRYLSDIAYSVGDARPLDALRAQEGLSTEAVETFRERGLREYRDDARSVPEMCVGSALETLRLAALDPAEVDSILIASSNSDAIVEDDQETALFAALNAAGFGRCRVLGLTLQACSACGDALRVAGGLLELAADARPVLVIIFGQKRVNRLGPQGNLVFSDGAASCLVSKAGGTFEICASESVSNTELGRMGRNGDLAQFHGGLIELREVARKVSGEAGIALGEVRAVLGTNAGLGHLQLMAQAAGIPIEKIYSDDVSRFAHVHSCDNLISLKHYAERNALADGEPLLLLSWSPHVVSASLVRYCASRN